MKAIRLAFVLSAVFATTAMLSGCNEPKIEDLVSIEVTKPANKTTYAVGEVFSPDGMVVTAHYSTGASQKVYDYSYYPGEPLKTTDSQITILYHEKEAYCPILVRNNFDDSYYQTINPNSNTLRNDLYTLNNSKIDHLVTFSVMLSNASHGFYVTDPGVGDRTITTFYSGNSHRGTTGLNREHVWPKSHGGNLVEDDIHMVRPTLEAENGSRGNSFYVEGKRDEFNGWDPAMESFGKESYRGDAARIIFYCAIANLNLTIVDMDYHATSNKNPDNMMGKLSDLLKWNLRYPVQSREMVRNDGAQTLQGNRNPFIDHPEYACKIWGNTNATTRQICGM